MTPVPMPLEWHPAYTDMVDLLLDWIEGRGQFADRHVIKYPKPTRPAAVAMSAYDTVPIEPLPRPLTLTKHKCAGAAPYVGRPFRYEWWAAEDDAHRWIAGDARIVYLPDHPWNTR